MVMVEALAWISELLWYQKLVAVIWILPNEKHQ